MEVRSLLSSLMKTELCVSTDKAFVKGRIPIEEQSEVLFPYTSSSSIT